jgi:Mrr restriction endonuclease-like protein
MSQAENQLAATVLGADGQTRPRKATMDQNTMRARGDARRRTETQDIPPQWDFAWPMLRAMRRLGQNATRAQLEEAAFDYMGLTQDQLSVMKPDGTQTEAANRAWWSVTYLKWARLIEDSERVEGWRLTRWSNALFQDGPAIDDVYRKAYVTGAAFGARRTEEGIRTRRIRNDNR